MSTTSATANTAQLSPNAFVGRQSILDRDQRLFGYELLFRSSQRENYFVHADGDQATCRTMNAALNVLGLNSLTGDHVGFVNITRQILLRELYTLLPADRIVIELLEDVEPDGQVIKACRKLKDHGYFLALDDFIFKPSYEPLLELADFVKIQFMGVSSAERSSITERLSRCNVKLLAEKVESHEDFEEGLRLGYSYFQGYFFCRPEVMSGREIPAYKQTYVRFLQQLNRPTIDFDQLEQIVRQDVSLSIKLLRYLNSAGMGLRVKIDSIRQALALLGEGPLKRWGSLIALTHLGDDKPAELVTLCLIRARFCELLAPLTGLIGRELDLFLLGLLSVADALVDSPMSDVLAHMPLASDVKAALLGNKTMLSTVIALTQACERCNHNIIQMMSTKLNIKPDHATSLYCESTVWADQILHM
jgi:EAL and modified HD-GYP domain-containing signal transduction protein